MNLANRLTAARLIMGPLFLIVFLCYRPGEGEPTGSIVQPALGLVIILASEFTDWLDGRLARKLGKETPFGALIDGFADSLTRLTFLTCFWALELIPVWMVLLAYYHDALGFFLRNLARGQNLILERRPSGRVMEGMLVAMAPLIVISMLAWHQDRLSWIAVERIAFWAAFTVVVVAVVSAVDYLIGNADALRKVPR